jgi:hypothetical protein
MFSLRLPLPPPLPLMYTPGDGEDGKGDISREEAAGDASREECRAERRPFGLEKDDGENDFGNDSMLSRCTVLIGRDSGDPEDGANGGGIPRRTGGQTAEAAADAEDDDAGVATDEKAAHASLVLPSSSPLLPPD